MWDDEDEERPAVGWVPLEGRGSLPYALLHGESLVAVASWALDEAGRRAARLHRLLGRRPGAGDRAGAPRPALPRHAGGLHRPGGRGRHQRRRVVAGVRPVTDTVKRREGGRARRDRRPGRAARGHLSRWCCPPPWSRRSDALPATDDLADLVAALRADHDGGRCWRRRPRAAGSATSPTCGSWRRWPPPTSRAAARPGPGPRRRSPSGWWRGPAPRAPAGRCTSRRRRPCPCR